MRIEDNPVLFPRLRCPRCRVSVRQIPHEPGNIEAGFFLLTEPVGYVVFGVGVVLGFEWQWVWLFILLCVPPFIWLHAHQLRRSQYSCIKCQGVFDYAAVRRTAI